MTYDLSPAIHWVKEREATRLRKESRDLGKAGGALTTDPIIAEWRFCNVRREDDRVTVWIRENIRERFAGHPLLWLMLCIARQLNWPPTLEYLIHTPDAWPADDRFSPERLEQALEDLIQTSDKVYTGAYIIPAPQKKGTKKSEYLAHEVIGKLFKAKDRFAQYLSYETKSLEGFHAVLGSYNGWGPFLAYQATVDIRFTPLLSGARDVATWCAAGPGTIRGLHRMYGEKIDAPMTQGVAKSRLVKMWPELIEQTGVATDLSDVPNVMCEVDKYLRVKNGEGQPRARYVPGRGY